MPCGDSFNPFEGAELVDVLYSRRHPWWKFWRHEMRKTFVFQFGIGILEVVEE